jgi:hypothetical protein
MARFQLTALAMTMLFATAATQTLVAISTLALKASPVSLAGDTAIDPYDDVSARQALDHVSR